MELNPWVKLKTNISNPFGVDIKLLRSQRREKVHQNANVCRGDHV